MADAMVRTRGVTVHVGTTASDPTSDSYTEIEKCRAIDGLFGRAWGQADVTTLADTFQQSIKTVANGGTITLGGPILEEAGSSGGLAPGQLALQAAATDDSDPDIYNIKFVGSSGRIKYIKARVMSFQRQFGNNSNVEEFRAQVAVMAQYTEADAA